MCYGRELDRDMRRDDEKLEEIRRLFARYREIAHQEAEREAPAEEPEEVPVLVGQ
jgi:hypothetical protein